jgi:hypothetical protein
MKYNAQIELHLRILDDAKQTRQHEATTLVDFNARGKHKC